MSAITYNLRAEDSSQLPICFRTAATGYKQENVRRSSGIQAHQILFVTEGKGRLILGGKEYPLLRGSAFYTGIRQPVTYLSDSDLVTAFVTFGGYAVDSLAEHYCPGGFLYRESIGVGRFVERIDRMIERYYRPSESGLASSDAYSVFVGFFERDRLSSTPTAAIEAYLMQNFMRRITLEELAAVAHCSVSKLCHDFKAHTGESVMSYLMEYRLRYARSMLVTECHLSVKEVAVSCGFDDVSYFCRTYKRRFDKTPTEER